MKKAFLVLITIIIVSCGSPDDISIFEKLTVEQKEELKEKHSNINNEWFDNFNVFKMANKEIEDKYNHITYGDIIEYEEFWQNNDKKDILTEDWNKEWSSKYLSTQLKVDSIKTHYEEVVRKEFYESADIKMNRLKTEYYRSIGGVKQVVLYVKVTPLNGVLDQIEFTINPIMKINQEDYDKFPDIYDRNKMRITENIFSDKPKTSGWIAKYSMENELAGKTTAEFNKIYNLNVLIESVSKDGENITRESLMPSVVFNDEGTEAIAKELLDLNFIEKINYINDKKSSYDLKHFPNATLFKTDLSALSKYLN
jgi:hypothetical protein